MRYAKGPNVIMKGAFKMSTGGIESKLVERM
jgi:hypothetical protein